MMHILIQADLTRWFRSFFFLFIHVATPTLTFVSDLIQGHNAISRFEDGRDK